MKKPLKNNEEIPGRYWAGRYWAKPVAHAWSAPLEFMLQHVFLVKKTA